MSSNIHFISAGAGSGKTYSLTKKLEELLSSETINPAGVIATTFTKLAAGELKERVRSRLIEAGQLAVANQMEQSLIGTVNSVCGEILRRFSFEAGMPPQQRVLDEAQGDILFYQAMEQALSSDKALIRQMNAHCHRLQILDRKQQLNWRAEIKNIADAARANNQSPADIRHLGAASADQLLAHFPQLTNRDLDQELKIAIKQAMDTIDIEQDRTRKTRDYLSLVRGVHAALYKGRATWPEWIKLSRAIPGAKSRAFSEPIADIAGNYERHPGLSQDIRFFAEKAFEIAAASLASYQQLKTQKGIIDFVDQEQRLYLLLDHPAVRDILQEELQLLMVDEFQDTSPIQLALFLKLSTLADRVIWVGDIKQSIYGFRGSDPTLMAAVVQRVSKDGNTPQILEKSWRSRPELVAYVNNLFVPAFSETLKPEQVVLQPARAAVPGEPAVELWRLEGKNKSTRALALAEGIRSMMANGKTVIDKQLNRARPACYGDIAVLCRTHANLSEIASALAATKLPLRYQRPGLLGTPEGTLAMACLRRLIDPLDTLASAEILSLTRCENPEAWVAQRIDYLNDPNTPAHHWREDEEHGPISELKRLRTRLPFLTPVEALRAALNAGDVSRSIQRWGPTQQRNQHRLNNLAALIGHAEEYMNQCTAQNLPATSEGLVLWLYQLASAEEDTQATGAAQDAIQLLTHHGAKGLEWPIVIAMDLDAKLKPRLWGLTVVPAAQAVSLEDPLAGRRLRYWPTFTGLLSANIPLLDKIGASPEGLSAMEREIEESRRLLYVSLTRPRDSLIFTGGGKQTGDEWMATLGAHWMLPDGAVLTLPDGTDIPTRLRALEASIHAPELPRYEPQFLTPTAPKAERLPLHLQPSSMGPDDLAAIGEIIVVGERLEIEGAYDPATLGSALHAVIATTIMGQQASERILEDHGLEEVVTAKSATLCARRLLDMIERRFNPDCYYTEYPVHYTTTRGQIVSGAIDLLLETEQGFVLIDHKASPRARSDWEEIAMSYCGQLQAYAEGVTRATGKPVLSRWIHFAVTGGLVEVARLKPLTEQ